MRTITLCTALISLMTAALAQNNTLNRGAGIPQEVLDAYEAHEFGGLPYRLLLPEDYDVDTKYPLVLSLHGRGGIGNDNESQMRHWLSTFVDKGWRAKYPCIVAAPQSEDSWVIDGETMPELTEAEISSYSETWRTWIQKRGAALRAVPEGSLTKAFKLVDKISQDYSIDTNRVYVLGHSMGGFGSWNAIWAAPERFAAAIPSAGGLLPWKDCANFKDIPIWAFHGGSDTTVPTAFTREIFDHMKDLGGNMKYTELEGVKHNASRWAFAPEDDEKASGYATQYSSDRCDKTANVWEWLFAQKRK